MKKILQTLFVIFIALASIGTKAETVTYFVNDAVGSPVAAMDQNGSLLWRENYNPYGDGRNKPSQNQNDIGFTGHQKDDATDLVYMQARYYDPIVGRFYSVDPVGFTAGNPMSFNRYLYVNNNPQKYTDPDGHFIFTTIAIVGAIMTAYDTYQAYQEGGVEGAVKSVATGAVISAATGGAGKIISKLIPSSVKKAAANYASSTIKKVTDKFTKKACCFVAGTQVLTEAGYKNIEDVKLGEKLWAKNTETGEEAWKEVTKVWVEADREIFEIRLQAEDGFIQKIEATDDHPFYVTGKGWKQTLELTAGDHVESNLGVPLTVIAVEAENKVDVTYNFTVADFHTYYVTKKNILVHNCGEGITTQASKGEVPDDYVVVRGGQSDMPPKGEVFSGSAGETLEDAAQGVPHGSVRATTAGDIKQSGGTVEFVPELTRSGTLNEKHVNICQGSGPCTFGPIQPNPVPKKDRIN